MLARASKEACTCSFTASVAPTKLQRFKRNVTRCRRRVVTCTALLKAHPSAKATWDQTTDDVLIKVPIDSSVRGKQVEFVVHPSRLELKVQGNTWLHGSLADAGEVNVDESFWTIEEEGGQRLIVITLAKKHMGHDSWAELLESDKPDATVTDRVYLDIAQNGQTLGKLVIGLFGNTVPRTTSNFLALASGERGVGASGKPLHLLGNAFHRIIPGFMAQGGDITDGDGTGGESIYGDTFEDENFKLKHDAAGVVAMANAGPNTNNSQFYITFGPQPHLDGKHVVFGKVEAGMQVLRQIEQAGGDDGTPLKDVIIKSCGVLPLDADLSEVEQANTDAMQSKTTSPL